MNIDPTNIPDTSATMKLAADSVTPTLTETVASGIAYFQTVLKGNEPVLTGAMRDSTDIEMLPPTADTVSGRVYVGVPLDQKEGVYYAIYVNDGTGQYAINQSLTTGRIKNGGIHPQQFMEKSMSDATPQIEAMFDEAAELVIARVV